MPISVLSPTHPALSRREGKSSKLTTVGEVTSLTSSIYSSVDFRQRIHLRFLALNMSAFASKRKARVIKVDDDQQPESPSAAPTSSQERVKDGTFTEPPQRPFANSADKANEIPEDGLAPSAAPVKFTKKPFRQSGLRKSTNVSEDGSDLGTSTATSEGRAAPAKATAANQDDEDEGPVVVRPTIGRSGSMKQKKRASSSRLSFGPGQDADDASTGTISTPKKTTLGQQALENSAVKKSSALSQSQRLPLRRFNDDDDDRPKYSKEYLEELQSSTPNTPQNPSAGRSRDDDDEMSLDESELEGAMIVNEGDYGPPPPKTTNILSNTEIQERKQRRARLAQEEQDFISLDDTDDPNKKKQESDTRLVPEDEDLGEGFDDFVEDGTLSLGKRAEREARARRRKEMAEQIQVAEGNSEDESDESDAERRAAFEAAQTRSGMDGLSKAEEDQNHHEAALQVPSKITPLPELEGCLEKLRTTIRGMEDELRGKRGRLEELTAERQAIVMREEEVQGLLDDAGRKYASAVGGDAAAAVEAGQSPAQQIKNAGMSELAVERGLESFGTPTQRPDVAE